MFEDDDTYIRQPTAEERKQAKEIVRRFEQDHPDRADDQIEVIPWTNDDGEVVEFIDPWASDWLAAYEKTSNVDRACKAVGIAQRTFYAARKYDKNFADAITLVRSRWVEIAETVLMERLRLGDTQLIIFALKAWKPEVYGDKSHTTSQNLHVVTVLDGREPREVPAHIRQKMAQELLQLEEGNEAA